MNDKRYEYGICKSIHVELMHFESRYNKIECLSFKSNRRVSTTHYMIQGDLHIHGKKDK